MPPKKSREKVDGITRGELPIFVDDFTLLRYDLFRYYIFREEWS